MPLVDAPEMYARVVEPLYASIGVGSHLRVIFVDHDDLECTHLIARGPSPDALVVSSVAPDGPSWDLYVCLVDHRPDATPVASARLVTVDPGEAAEFFARELPRLVGCL